jgi:hypothetical protein
LAFFIRSCFDTSARTDEKPTLYPNKPFVLRYRRTNTISNHRWIAGAKWCVAVNHLGEIIGWVWAPANANDTWFRPLLDVFDDRTVLFSDTGFHSAQGDPANLKICRRGERNDRMLIETTGH